jgi:zinc protease
MRNNIIVNLFIGITAATSTVASTTNERTLDNGLKVIVREDHRAPVVTSQIWYRIGASYEPEGLTGISHALEHMMFKGTEKYGSGKFSEIISANGGDDNAFTGRDYTAYFQNLASDRLAIAFELEADRMRNLVLPAAEFAKEIEVIKEERRLRTDDNPNNFVTEQFYANAYLLSPYRHPIIGWMNDLEFMTIDHVRAWYRQWYVPNNATLVVVGDVDSTQVFALAHRYFGTLKSEAITKQRLPQEPSQMGMKRIKVQIPAQEPYLIMGYKTHAMNSSVIEWEPYALEMLASILSNGASSRFNRELVRGNEIAAAADADYSIFTRVPDAFTLDGTPAKGHTIEELEQSLRQQIEQIKTEFVSEAELNRVRNMVVASKIFEQDSLFYQAMQIGLLETLGLGWQLADQYVDKLSAVTAEQVQMVARKYLVDTALTVTILDPQP